MLNPIEEPLLKSLLTEVKQDDDILAVLLYGSYVRNDVYHDIDVCIVGFPDKNPLPLQKVLFYKGNFPSKLDVQFFNDLPIYIQSRVIKEGIIIINKDFDLLFDIYETTIRSYTDFYPHFKQYLEVD